MLRDVGRTEHPDPAGDTIEEAKRDLARCAEDIEDAARDLRATVTELRTIPRARLDLTESELRCLIDLASRGESNEGEAVRGALKEKALQLLAIEIRPGGHFEGPPAA